MELARDTERAILGVETAAQVRSWVARHVRDHVGGTVESVLFSGGDIGAVFGLRLSDGREVVLKALRPGANARRLRAVVRAQNALASSGYGCARVLDGPSSTDGVFAIVEERLTCTPTGSPHEPAVRGAMAAALAAQINALRGMDGADLVQGGPAWSDWSVGAWPVPHDPIFDFTVPVPGYEWVDELADASAAVLRAAEGPAVVGHSDWVWQNVCVRDGTFVAAYDWDSLVYLPEPAVVGQCAGAFSQGSPVRPDAPTAAQVAAFLDDYERVRPFTPPERRVAEAAATWVRCYSARCQLDNLQRRGMEPPAGSFIEALST
ncbi:phosphotransferase [Tenggerimyces flavus]|uniref:Phosphotransferase n=1 Tax=Tenggerimyces flavus TaxID=1708749 RepID=A0ABV7YER1_9ACTN|nr:phosphotransferase [Tenggerimyces flavus]MBM7786857.1 Ser/Thr protein kinase RdoA (MazF antagonist) [Tenggerimyces flavus]